jgi:hypothetical protein
MRRVDVLVYYGLIRHCKAFTNAPDHGGGTVRAFRDEAPIDSMKRTSSRVALILALVAALSGAAVQAAQVAAARTARDAHRESPSARLFARYRGFVGNDAATHSLIQGLRFGELIKLTGENRGRTAFLPPTPPMGWVNIDHALDLTRREALSLGLTHPSALELRALLMGGEVRNAHGEPHQAGGVLTLRSQGLPWQAVAARLGLEQAVVGEAAGGADSQGPAGGGDSQGAAGEPREP